MNEKIKQLLENSKGKTIGVFIDNANWFYPQKELGWQVSFSKLLILLKEYFEIKTVKDLDMVIVGSGDSDFLEAKNFVIENKKSFLVLCFEKGVAWEMRKLHHIFLEDLRDIIKQEKQKEKIG
ncbi:MAG: hypothetical protein WAN61_00610 [Minisyncoccia bacterium]